MTKRALWLLALFLTQAPALIAGVEGARSERERAALHDRIVLRKLDTVLGPAMRANNVDMWIVLTREYNVDPVFPFITPDGTYPGGRNAYVFIDAGGARPQRLVIGSHQWKQGAPFFDAVIAARGARVGEELRRLCELHQPKRIAVNIAHETSAADGLTASMRDGLTDALGPEFSRRLVSSERLVIDYLDTRLPEEEALFRDAAELTRRIWEEAFTLKVITPGKTTVGDVLWFIRQRCADHNVGIWFRPDIRVQRRGLQFDPSEVAPDDFVIEPGDVLHLDFGIIYLDFHTDYQKHFYVPRKDETDVPAGLKRALANTNKLQDILLSEMKPGRTGEEVYAAAMERAEANGLQAMIYSHSIGNFGHFVGAAIGSFTTGPTRGLRRQLPLRLGSYTSIELNTRTAVPEWDGQEVYIMMEDDAALAPDGMKWFIPRQTDWHIVSNN
ncbi:MAG TPA: M24 family metallopeptidase [Candidatus Xenobia bacterium]|nr:M24 family metallopeptidase [Candidatus Xenobia bacterium]